MNCSIRWYACWATPREKEQKGGSFFLRQFRMVPALRRILTGRGRGKSPTLLPCGGSKKTQRPRVWLSRNVASQPGWPLGGGRRGTGPIPRTRRRSPRLRKGPCCCRWVTMLAACTALRPAADANFEGKKNNRKNYEAWPFVTP